MVVLAASRGPASIARTGDHHKDKGSFTEVNTGGGQAPHESLEGAWPPQRRLPTPRVSAPASGGPTRRSGGGQGWSRTGKTSSRTGKTSSQDHTDEVAAFCCSEVFYF